MSQCRAAHCQVDLIEVEGREIWFCRPHWGLLTPEMQKSLFDSWKSEDWPIALDECVRALRRIEGYTQPRERDR